MPLAPAQTRLTLSHHQCFKASAISPPTEKAPGKIEGYSVISAGEAQGHGLWIDEDFLDQVAAAGQATEKGFKTRSNHPNLCAPGFGTYLGRTYNFRRKDGKILADFRSSIAADSHKLDHLFAMAAEEPDMFGASIVFSPDYGQMEKFSANHKNAKGDFISPDPANTNNYPHARLAALHASDFVDEPAANNDGLFSFEAEKTKRQAESLLDFIFGNSDDEPIIPELGALDAPRIKGFVRQYFKNHGMNFRKEKIPMPQEPKQQDLKELFDALKTEFSADPAFLMEMFSEQKPVEEARSIFKDREIARLNKENAALLAQAKRPADAQPVPDARLPEPGQTNTSPEAFEAAAKKLANERGIDLGDAYSLVAKENPAFDRLSNF